MVRIAELSADLILNTTQFQGAVRDVGRSLSQVTRDLQNSVGREYQRTIRASTEETERFGRRAERSFRSISNVISGILIARVLNDLLRTLRRITDAVIDFAQEAEQAAIAFSTLLGSSAAADSFLRALEDFAATTPFILSNARASARTLLAMGFAARDIIPTLRIIIDAVSAAGGDPEVLNRIVRAFGQIQTQGRLTQRQLIRLAQAGIPVYRILQEQLGLTRDEIINISRLRIPADVGIQALLRGIQEEFGGLSQQLETTTRGLTSTIQDNFLLIARDVFEPFFDSYREFLTGIRDTLVSLRLTVRQFGIGGLLNEVFGQELADDIRRALILFQSLGRSLRNIFIIIGQIAGIFGRQFLRIFVTVLPPIVRFIELLTTLIVNILRSSRAVRFLVAAFATLEVLGGVIVILARIAVAIRALTGAVVAGRAVAFLTRAIRFLYLAITAQPIVAVVTILIGILLKLALSSEFVVNSLRRLGEQIQSFFGVDIGNLLEPNTTAISDFGESVQDSFGNLADQLEEAEDMVDGFLASFDEVYTIPEQLDNAGFDLENLFPEGTFDLDEIIDPDVTIDPGDQVSSILDDLRAELEGQDPLVFPPFIFPDPPAFPPGATAGILETFLDITDELELAYETVSSSIESFFNDLAFDISAGLELALDGGLELARGFIEDLSGVFSPTGQLALALNNLGETITDTFRTTYDLLIRATTDLGPELSRTWRNIINNIVNTIQEGGSLWRDTFATGADNIEEVAEELRRDLGNSWAQTLESLRQTTTVFIENNFDDFDNWSGLVQGVFATWSTAVIDLLRQWASETGGNIRDWTRDTGERVGDWVRDTEERIRDWTRDTGNLLRDWTTSTLETVSVWVTDTSISINNWAVDTSMRISEWSTEVQRAIGNWATNVNNAFSDWRIRTFNTINSWVNDVIANFRQWSVQVLNTIVTWVIDAFNSFFEGFRDIQNLVNDALSIIQGFWEEHSDTILTILGLLALGIIAAFAAFTLPVTATVAAFVGGIVLFFTDMGVALAETTEETAEDVVRIWDEFLTLGEELFQAFTDFIQGLWTGLLDGTRSVWNSIRRSITSVIDSIIDGFEDATEAIQDFLGARDEATRGGGGFGVPGGVGRFTQTATALDVPGLQRGGIVTRDTLIRAGEQNRPEAIVPLTGDRVRPFANAVARELGFAEGDRGTGVDPLGVPATVLYVGTLVADDRSIRELERRLNIVRTQEVRRR